MKTERTRRPRRLAPGDLVAIAAPASAFDRNKFERGADVLKSMGFRIFTPAGLFSRKGYLAGKDRQRAEILEEIFESPEIAAVVCARGGYGSMRILNRINYDVVAENPKIFVGFSDITALLNAFYTKCGLGTIHGPTLTCLAEADRVTIEAFFSALTSGDRVSILSENAVAIKTGKACGPVAGGNLTTLCHLTGLSYMPSFEGHILFLEDRGEAPYRIDRMLTHMELAGVFEKINGLVLGDFSDCGGKETIYEIFEEQFEKYEIPVLAGLAAGHEKTNLALPFGIRAFLDAEEKVLSYFRPPTEEANEGNEAVSRQVETIRGCGSTGVSSKASDDFSEKIDRIMLRAVGDFVFPGAVLMVSMGDSILFHKAYGVRSILSGHPVTVNTFFDLASLTKPLATSLAIMNLVKDGMLDVEQRLGEIIEEFKGTDKSDIRIRHLLCHTSGLPDYRPYYRELTNRPLKERKERLHQLLVGEKLRFPVGRKTRYSDLGFMVLAWISEVVSGCRLDRFVEEKIYAPLGLENLFFASSTGKRSDAEFAATEKCMWRNKILEGEVHDENAAVVGGVEGHAGLFGTAENVRRLLRHLSKIYENTSYEGLFPADTVRAFFHRKSASERAMGFDVPSPEGSSSGRYFSYETIGHLGFTGASFWADLSRSLIVVLLTNRVHPVRDNERLKAFRPAVHDEIMKAAMRGWLSRPEHGVQK